MDTPPQSQHISGRKGFDEGSAIMALGLRENPFGSGANRFWWNPSEKGEFTTKSAYALLASELATTRHFP